MAWITRKRDRWAVEFYDQNKTRRLKVLPKVAKKADAKAKLREIEEQVLDRSYISDKDIPLFSQVAEDWIAHKKGSLRHTTWVVYQGHVRHHFKGFDSLKINLIDTPMIEKWIDRKVAEGMNIGTLKKILVSLNQIFTYAKRHHYIKVNPLTDAEKPKGKKRKIVLLNADQVRALLKKTDEVEYRVLFMLGVMSGARQGELLALRWSDIRWRDSQVHIHCTFSKGEFYETKTEKERLVDLSPLVMDVLREWREICPESREGLIFPNGNGHAMNYSNMVNRHFLPALKSAGLPRLKFHSLRHTYASLLIDQRENVVYISEQLGHSSPSITLDVYSHLFKKKNQDAPLKLQGKIFGHGDRMETKSLNLLN